MRIGILGGGQLAMMMVQQSEDTNFDFLILDPTESPPASKYAKCIKAEYDDTESLNYIADECDVVTIDFENVPADTLRFLEQRIIVAPNSSAVEICQDRLKDIGSETLYFIISALNQLNMDPLRNKILLKVLPLKV